ncbi:MAG: superoxide dismutase [Bacteroidetes bacterium]|nr:superoxide dismutase [Bacteroidota bacterium]
MKIIALEKELPGITDDMFTSDILRTEAERALELYQSGKIRELYFRHDRQEAVLILECDNMEEAQSVLATLPLVKKGLIAFEIIPLIAYPGFSRLLENQKR